MKRFRHFSTLMQSQITPHTEFTRQYIAEAKKLTEKYQTELIIQALNATQKNLEGAKKYMGKDNTDITKAREYYEGAVDIATRIYQDKDSDHFLTVTQKKTLSETFSGYAEFLRWTTKADSRETIADLIHKALTLNPENKEAIATRDDIKYTYKLT